MLVSDERLFVVMSNIGNWDDEVMGVVGLMGEETYREDCDKLVGDDFDVNSMQRLSGMAAAECMDENQTGALHSGRLDSILVYDMKSDPDHNVQQIFAIIAI